MFTNLMKSSLVAMMGFVVVGSTATPAEAQHYARRQHVSRPAYRPVREQYRHHNPVVVVNRPRYYTTPVYYNRPVVYTQPIVYREPVYYSEPVYTQPVVYREPTVVYSQPSCGHSVVYSEPVYYSYPRDRFSVDFNFGRSGHHSSFGGGIGFDWR